MSEFESKEALRAATDWLVVSDPPGGMAARDGISEVIPLVMMGQITPRDLDDLASIVEQNSGPTPDPGVPLDANQTQIRAAIQAAFEHVKSHSGDAAH